jgi:hypothetical protein
VVSAAVDLPSWAAGSAAFAFSPRGGSLSAKGTVPGTGARPWLAMRGIWWGGGGAGTIRVVISDDQRLSDQGYVNSLDLRHRGRWKLLARAMTERRKRR